MTVCDTVTLQQPYQILQRHPQPLLQACHSQAQHRGEGWGMGGLKGECHPESTQLTALKPHRQGERGFCLLDL